MMNKNDFKTDIARDRINNLHGPYWISQLTDDMKNNLIKRISDEGIWAVYLEFFTDTDGLIGIAFESLESGILCNEPEYRLPNGKVNVEKLKEKLTENVLGTMDEMDFKYIIHETYLGTQIYHLFNDELGDGVNSAMAIMFDC